MCRGLHFLPPLSKTEVARLLMSGPCNDDENGISQMVVWFLGQSLLVYRISIRYSGIGLTEEDKH